MSKSPFYKTGISKSPFNQLPDNSKPEPELLINRPKPVTGIEKPTAIGMQKGSPAKQTYRSREERIAARVAKSKALRNKKRKDSGSQAPAKQVQNKTATYTAGTGGSFGKKRLKGAAADKALAESEVMQKKSPSKQKGSPAKNGGWSGAANKLLDLLTPSPEAKAARVAGRVAKIERRNARKAARAKK